MFTEKIIRKVIQRYLDMGVRDFVIYPFGANGMAIKNCMQECFDLTPVMVVDNALAQYNARIADIQKLREVCREEWYVILTVEKTELNKELMDNLLTFLPKDRVINDLIREKEMEECNTRKSRGVCQVRTRFALQNILPSGHKTREYASCGRIKVRIMNASYPMWNSVKTICEAFEKDLLYDVLVILYDQMNGMAKDKLIEQMEREGHQYIYASEYCAEEDHADILILSMLWVDYGIKGVRENTKLIVVSSMDLINYSKSVNKYWEDRYIGLEMYRPDYCLVDSMLFEELQTGGKSPCELIEMGSAKFDGIWRSCQKKQYPVGWEKLRGKTVILWTTTHGIYNGCVTNIVTFDLYAKIIFEYAEQNPAIGVVVRPHPTFIYNELLKYGYWRTQDLEAIKKYCENTPNIVWDDTDLYEAAYSVADAILTDDGCGIMISALPTLKPICVMYRGDMETAPYNAEIEKNYYSVYDKQELISFLDMVREGKDPMLEQRKVLADKWVKHFDGRNGERIKEFIAHKFDLIDMERIQ